jgi:RND family efflux transporter MFP subunit
MSRLIWGLLTIALAGLVAMRVNESKRAASATVEKPAEAALIRTTRVTRGEIRDVVSFTGNVRARNEVDVYAKLPGRVESVHARVGEKVRAGELLAVVEHREVSWQAKQAQAAVQAAQAGAQAAQATVQVAQAGVDGARLEHDRTLELAKGGSAPAAAVDGVKVKLRLAEAQLQQAKSQVAATLAQIQAAQAAAGLVEQQVDNARIEAPITGVVTKKNVSVGTMAAPQLPAFTVQDVGTLKLESTVDAAQYARLARGMAASIRVDAFGDEAFQGRVDVLQPTLDPQTRRAMVEIAIDNASGRLLPHLFARADVTVGTLPEALLIPREALLQAPGGAVVFRVRGGKAEAVRPKLGPEDGALVAVLEGLAEGDELALTGLGNLSDGAAVKAAATVSQK